MKYSEFLGKISKDSGMSKKAADEAIKSIFYTITKEVALGEVVKIPMFGSFSKRVKEGFSTQANKNFSTARIHFRGGVTLKRILNAKRSK